MPCRDGRPGTDPDNRRDRIGFGQHRIAPCPQRLHADLAARRMEAGAGGEAGDIVADRRVSARPTPDTALTVPQGAMASKTSLPALGAQSELSPLVPNAAGSVVPPPIEKWAGANGAA